MKKYFSLSLYREGLKRVRGSGVASAIVLVTLVGMRILLMWVLNAGLNFDEPETIDVFNAMPLAYVIIVLAPLVVMRMFSFLNSRSASDFYHSIPQKRICLFLSFFAAALTWVVGVVLAGGLVCYIGWNCTLCYSVSFFTVARCVISYTALGLLSASCMALAVTLTGSGFSTLFAYACIFGMPPLLGNVLGLFIREFNGSFVITRSVFRVFGTRGFLPLALMNGDFYKPLGLPVASAVVIFLLLTALAALAFVKRKSEAAGNSTVTPLFQHILRCCAGFPIWLLVAYFFMLGEKAVGLVFIPASLAIYVVYELITTRRLKNVVKSLPVFLALPLLCISLVGTAALGGKAVAITTPRRANEISYATITGDGFYIDAVPMERISGAEITDKAVLSCFIEGVEHADSYQNLIVMMELKSGRTVYRRIGIDYSNSEALMRAFSEDEQCAELLLTLPSYESITSDELDAYYWQVFTEEYNALTNEQKLSVYGYGDEEELIPIRVTERCNGKKISVWYRIDRRNFPQTYAYLSGKKGFDTELS